MNDALETATAPPAAGQDSHPVVSLFAAFFWVILWLLSCIRSLVAFVTISIPRFIIYVLSYSLTLTLNFWTLAVLFVISGAALAVFIRIRYLGRYSNLREPPLTKPGAEELHPDVNAADPPPAFHDYLDDFLQAIRVFGFLEKPVFHELARHVQTRRLVAGDSLSLDQDKSFYCVMDGTVQVFAKAGSQGDEWTQWEGEDMNGYQLLNEVGTGSTLSSLFTILSLFTEDVQIAWKESNPDIARSTSLQRDDADVPTFDLAGSGPSSSFELVRVQRPRPQRSVSVSSEGSTIHPVVTEPPEDPSEPWEDARPVSRPDTPVAPRPPRTPGEAISQLNHGTIARATVDSTLAVIPAEAFRRLTKKFPKASGHIVQGKYTIYLFILTRFSRVTFHAAHKYLGLTSELLRTEKAINDLACHPLPDDFYARGGLQTLRHRLDALADADSSDEDDEDYFGNATQPSVQAAKLRVDTKPRQRVLDTQEVVESPVSKAPPPFTPYKSHGSRSAMNAGDLLTMTGHASAPYLPSNRPVSVVQTGGKKVSHLPSALTRSVGPGDVEFNLRDEVMGCIAKSIGLLQPPLGGSDSSAGADALGSPGVFSMRSGASSVSGQHRPLFNASFGGGLPMAMSHDESSSSLAGMSSSNDSLYPSGLDNDVEILFFAAGSSLVTAGEKNAGLFYVIDGFLDVSLPSDESSSDDHVPRTKERSTSTASKPTTSNSNSQPNEPEGRHLFTVKPGGIAGYLSSLTNTASYVDIKAKTDAYVGFLPAASLERLIEKSPIVLLTLAKRLISLLSPLVLQIDASLDWTQVDGGQVLWRPEDDSDCFYIVINGRLRALTEKPGGGVTIKGEYGQGDSTGELDVITRSPRRTTLHAIRDTELIRMPVTLFNAISARNPQATSQILRIIASRVRDEVDSSVAMPRLASITSGTGEVRRNNFNMKTVAILPVSQNIPIESFAKKLHAAFESIGAPTAYLNQASVMSHLGRHAFTRMGQLKVASWLTDQELRYRMVMYVVDSPVSAPWTQTCIRQADCILVVGAGDSPPATGEYERLLLSTKTTARKELVLLHPDRNVLPGSTREWLKNRPWVHAHMHVELPGLTVAKSSPSFNDPAAVIALKQLKDSVQSRLQRYTGYYPPGVAPRPHRPKHMNDFARLARRLCGKSVGVVLGGGGARGISHLGALRAFEEYGVPIDHIGGTSIGSFIGGLYAREMDIFSAKGKAKHFAGRVASVWRILSDITWPVVAYTTGHEFNRTIYKAFYDLHIEDMWLPYFCNTTNIRLSRMEIHETGYAWRFIRASMTLVGLLPPLSDNGDMLVDGGYLDNLPVPTMLSMGVNTVFAVDVGSLDDTSPRVFGDTVSGWWLLLNRWNPFSSQRNIPGITDIQARLAYVSSVVSLEEAKSLKGCLYMGMPVQDYGTLQFGLFAEIEEKGYRASCEMLERWKKEGRLPAMSDESQENLEKKKKGRSLRRNSI
ncbi:patatin-domain-containing protein [Exidia glandulosa HHB12029]|uniref:Lysophospholipase NTE1 n=1 Tax=Exidia glandulosa HHB12029 TaxID=1314781 RepID=A0A165DDU4_EXIGL|nr:patatin-domain-containing protein [Exidia glandulosa HHB12029]